MEPTREDYRLLAEFMGWTLDDADTDMYRKPEGYVNIYRKLANFNFHTDWNELMKVIEEIGKKVEVVKSYQTKTFSGKWYTYVIKFYNFSGLTEMVVAEVNSDYTNGESKISTHYRGAVEFIKQYNLNKVV